jgi:hypothetical protein
MANDVIAIPSAAGGSSLREHRYASTQGPTKVVGCYALEKESGRPEVAKRVATTSRLNMHFTDMVSYIQCRADTNCVLIETLNHAPRNFEVVSIPPVNAVP